MTSAFRMSLRSVCCTGDAAEPGRRESFSVSIQGLSYRVPVQADGIEVASSVRVRGMMCVRPLAEDANQGVQVVLFTSIWIS